MEIAIYNSKNEVAEALAQRLDTWCREEGLRSMALSGGSTPKVWFDVLAGRYGTRLPWEDLVFFWGDERCVPPDHPESNYGMAREHLFSKVPVPRGNIHRIRGEADPGEEALRYGRLLETALPVEEGFPRLDLVILGLGEDGHTASIFPHEIGLWDSGAFCAVATHPQSGQKRITLTGGIINHARRVVFLVTGASKAARVREITGALEGSGQLPASRVAPASGSLVWMLDREAAAALP